MKSLRSLAFAFLTSIAAIPAVGGETPLPVESEHDHSRFEDINLLTGEGVSIGDILVPRVFALGTFGAFDGDAEDFAFSEHDPRNDAHFQAIEAELMLNWNDRITGVVSGVFFPDAEENWEGELEEAYLHFHLTDRFAFGGGRYLTRFGFQNDQHVHSWAFVNQNLVNSRILNEGHLTTEGGEFLIKTPKNSGQLTVGVGGVLTHEHGHGHDEDEDEHGHEEDEHGHEEGELEAEDGDFRDIVVSTDYRFRTPFDKGLTLSASFAAGENNFRRNTYAYGVGVQKVWNGHDHGFGGPDFCTGALMLRSEFIGRAVEAREEHDGNFEYDDYGISTGLFYGVGEGMTAGIRYDWVSGVDEVELPDTHRISPAVSVFLDPGQRIQARLQYDYLHDDVTGSQHAGYLQFQIQWGGEGGSHFGHEH